MVEFQRSETPVARKSHRCFLCQETIRPGEKYYRTVYKDSGDFGSEAYHLDCIGIVDRYFRTFDPAWYNPEDVLNWVEDAVCLDCEHRKALDYWRLCGRNENPFRCPVVLKTILQKEVKDETHGFQGRR